MAAVVDGFIVKRNGLNWEKSCASVQKQMCYHGNQIVALLYRLHIQMTSLTVPSMSR